MCCRSLEKVTIPRNVKFIDDYAFANCNALNEDKVYINRRHIQISKSAFKKGINDFIVTNFY